MKVALRSGTAAALVLAALIAGLVASIHGARNARTEIATQAALPRVDGRVDVFHNTEQTRFVQFVVDRVPAHDRVRIVMAPPTQVADQRTICGRMPLVARYWVLVYGIAPRASVCDSSARWVVYFGVAPPPGGTVYRFTSNYAVVRL
ncbi:MAG TPA: hypothetical protein VKB37_10395 [Jatrophihabitantaceae bacterium]|jgi:hypothetical protein|nr:hypothetical protein [Jatrophihabitantaceae bacterium]